MKKLTKKEMVVIAKREIDAWNDMRKTCNWTYMNELIEDHTEDDPNYFSIYTFNACCGYDDMFGWEFFKDNLRDVCFEDFDPRVTEKVVEDLIDMIGDGVNGLWKYFTKESMKAWEEFKKNLVGNELVSKKLKMYDAGDEIEVWKEVA